MKISNLLLIVLLAAAIGACTLSAKQEANLNAQLGKYITATNESRLLETVGLTQPQVVRFYHAQGDSAFIKHFQHGMETNDYLEDPLYREMKQEKSLIHRKYRTRLYTEEKETSDNYFIFAISTDKGDNWLFVRQEDYFNDSIKGFKRLFRK